MKYLLGFVEKNNIQHHMKTRYYMLREKTGRKKLITALRRAIYACMDIRACMYMSFSSFFHKH